MGHTLILDFLYICNFVISAYHIGQIDPLNAQKCLVFRCGGKSSSAALILVTGGMISVQHVVSKPIGGDIATGTTYRVFNMDWVILKSY